MSGKYLNQTTKEHIQEQKLLRKRVLSVMTRWALGLAAVTILLLNLFSHVLQIVHYNGKGMEPNLHNGQMLILLKTQEVTEGDIIAFYYNNQVLVRRVVCTGGKQLIIKKDGTVTVNNQVQEEPYLTEKTLGQCNLTFPYHVRTGCVFVMGDNRAIAMDSRLSEIGVVPHDRIIGKIIFAF